MHRTAFKEAARNPTVNIAFQHCQFPFWVKKFCNEYFIDSNLYRNRITNGECGIHFNFASNCFQWAVLNERKCIENTRSQIRCLSVCVRFVCLAVLMANAVASNK